MPEPASSASFVTVVLFAAASTLLGPLLGPIMLVVITSSVGAFIAAAEAETAGVRHVFVFVLRGALFATVLAFGTADWVEIRFGLVGHSALAAIAAGIGYRAHRLGDLLAIARAMHAAATKGWGRGGK